MDLSLRPLCPHFGVEIQNFDSAKLEDYRSLMLPLLLKHQLVLVRQMNFTAPELIAFADLIGTILPFTLTNYRHPEHPEIMISSNEEFNGQPLGMARVGNFWHSDSSFIADPPNTTVLYGLKIPPTGGDTLFASTYQAYDELPLTLKLRMAGKQATHTIRKRYKVTERDLRRSLHEIDQDLRVRIPDVIHPVIRRHPLTGRSALFVSEGYTLKIHDVDSSESQEFLEYAADVMTRDDRVYRHKWQKGDVLIWDNPSLIHAVCESDPSIPRTMWRITVK